MQNKNYMYLMDNQILFYCVKKNLYQSFLLSNKIVEDGKIIHRPKFLREFKIFLKKNHIIKKFQKNILYLITPPNFTEIDKEILHKIFEEVPFQEWKLIKEQNLYDLKKNTLWVNINKNYAYLTYLTKKHVITNTLKENYLNLSFLDQINSFLQNNPKIKKIYMIGNNPEINKISKKLEEKSHKIVLYYEHSDKIILEKAFRHNLT